ncbi:MAG TPA: hypothetical protein VKM55_30095 [Candidatus Lokiarchaeia archaeon]|nr:hypothetical protein [Candidatus Lokiarchaeia archaeon]
MKRRLEELQARLLLDKQKINQQKLLEKLLEYSLEHVDLVFESDGSEQELEQDYAWKMLEMPKSWGISDSSKKIDEYLYGEES